MVRQGPGTRLELRNHQGESVHVHSPKALSRAAAAALHLRASSPCAGSGAGKREDRPDPADDRRPSLDRQADRQCRSSSTCSRRATPVGRQEDRGHPQGRRRGPDNTSGLAQRTDRHDKVKFHCRISASLRPHWRPRAGNASQDPEIVMAAGTSIITERSPISCATVLPSRSRPPSLATGPPERIKKVATLCIGLCPGNDALNFFKQNFTAGGGRSSRRSRYRWPIQIFAPFLPADEGCQARRHVRVSWPAGQGGNFMKQYASAGSPASSDRSRRRHGRRSPEWHGRRRRSALSRRILYSAAHPPR